MTMSPKETLDAAIARAADIDFGSGSAAVLYSGSQTLVPGPVYVMAYNPGGDSEKTRRTVVEDLKDTAYHLKKDHCAYLEEWENGRGGNYPNGEHPHQRRFKKLAAALRLEPERIPAANAIFVRTRSAVEVDTDLFVRCWSIHSILLSAIRPRAIVCIGNGRTRSSYALLASSCANAGVSPVALFAEPFRRGRSFVARKLDLGTYRALDDVLIVGLPHFSRFEFDGEWPVVDRLRHAIGDQRL